MPASSGISRIFTIHKGRQIFMRTRIDVHQAYQSNSDSWVLRTI
jgi:hypothetical protein